MVSRGFCSELCRRFDYYVLDYVFGKNTLVSFCSTPEFMKEVHFFTSNLRLYGLSSTLS